MFGLVIAMSIVALGKVRGQFAPVPEVINVQILSSYPVDPRFFTVPEQGRLVSLTPQFLPRQIAVVRVDPTDRSESSDRYNSGLNLRPLTLTENLLKRRVLTPQRTADSIRLEEGKINALNVDQNVNNPVSSQVNIYPDQPQEQMGSSPPITAPKVTTKKTDELESGAKNEQSFQNSTRVNATNGQPTVVDKATGVEVTLDERASFDGDKCPTGTVRVNDKCVKKD